MANVNFKNNGKLKLLIIVGTRPEIIRLSAVIKACRKYFDGKPYLDRYASFCGIRARYDSRTDPARQIYS